MQYETESQRNNGDFLPFSPNQAGLFDYPISAPASASAFNNARSFWDPDTSMNEMDLDFSTTDWTPSHKVSNSLEWGKTNQLFHDISNNSSFNTNQIPISQAPHHDSRQQPRPIAPKPSASQSIHDSNMMSFDFGVSGVDDPFTALMSAEAVNPELLFGLEALPLGIAPDEQTPSQPKRPSTSQVVREAPREPYQHQLRELRRDQEELRRSRTYGEASALLKHNKASFSSPIRRPALQRSVSDSRARRSTTKRDRVSSEGERQQSSRDDRHAPSHGRSSPVKQFGRPNLSSIPETFIPPRTRAAVTFTIDAHGRARTETTLIVEKQKTSPGGPQPTDSDASSQGSGYSSDEDPIVLPPNPKKTFALPDKVLPDKAPKLAHFPTASRNSSRRRESGSGLSQSSEQQISMINDDSEAETITDERENDIDGVGDAAIALRKVMERRSDRRKRSSVSSITPRGNLRLNTSYGLIKNTSPTTLSDPDLGTPSTDLDSTQSPSTRCVCHNPDGEGFMIQCESCTKWQHAKCVGITRSRLPPVWICAFCAQTPNMRGGRMRDAGRSNGQMVSSPLAHKSFQGWR